MTDPHLPDALRILARDIYCEDGIATQCIREAADEIERLRLTDAEREAVAYYVGTGGPDTVDATLRGLLERMT
jgi:hypothetical protein